MKIRFLYFQGCPDSEPALGLLKTVLSEEGVTDRVEKVEVTDFERAEREHFLGSPSIQIDGLDIEPSRGGDAPCFGCRAYRTERDSSGVPTVSMIRSAIRSAKTGQAKEHEIR